MNEKTVAVIAEYNPFHLGHLYQLQEIKKRGASKIIVIMSGNYTQRGSCAVLDKYVRAKHAVLGGADMVIELPTIFSTSNAETFAVGAIKILSKLNVDCLYFGVESGTKQDFLTLANHLLEESKEYKEQLKKLLKTGVSLINAKNTILQQTLQNDNIFNLLSTPNNVLGVEYVKAILKYSKMDFDIIKRTNDHSSTKLQKGISSATSIRNALYEGKIKKVKKSVPSFVYNDLKNFVKPEDKQILSSIIKASNKDLLNVPDCTEGLENRIKSCINGTYTVEDAVNKISTKRYTKARIRRIFIANYLGINNQLVETALKNDNYAKVLAIKKEETELLTKFSNCKIPLILRKSDTNNLSKTAQKVFEIDVIANDLYNLNQQQHKNEYYTEKV